MARTTEERCENCGDELAYNEKEAYWFCLACGLPADVDEWTDDSK